MADPSAREQPGSPESRGKPDTAGQDSTSRGNTASADQREKDRSKTSSGAGDATHKPVKGERK